MTNDERALLQPSHSYVSVFVIVCIRVVKAVTRQCMCVFCWTGAPTPGPHMSCCVTLNVSVASLKTMEQQWFNVSLTRAPHVGLHQNTILL